MPQRLIYDNGAGGVSVIIPAINSGLSLMDIGEKDVPQGFAFSIVATSAIPSDRTFREAWKKNGIAVDVDMPIARDIKRDMLREERAGLLEVEDVAFMMALENSQPTAAITARKQRLRDVTIAPEIDTATTPEELLAFRPTVFDE